MNSDKYKRFEYDESLRSSYQNWWRAHMPFIYQRIVRPADYIASAVDMLFTPPVTSPTFRENPPIYTYLGYSGSMAYGIFGIYHPADYSMSGLPMDEHQHDFEGGCIIEAGNLFHYIIQSHYRFHLTTVRTAEEKNVRLDIDAGGHGIHVVDKQTPFRGNHMAYTNFTFCPMDCDNNSWTTIAEKMKPGASLPDKWTDHVLEREHGIDIIQGILWDDPAMLLNLLRE